MYIERKQCPMIDSFDREMTDSCANQRDDPMIARVVTLKLRVGAWGRVGGGGGGERGGEALTFESSSTRLPALISVGSASCSWAIALSLKACNTHTDTPQWLGRWWGWGRVTTVPPGDQRKTNMTACRTHNRTWSVTGLTIHQNSR